MRIALDTNIVAYAEGVNGAARRADTLTILDRLPLHARVVPVQVLGELYRVLTRKAKMPGSEAQIIVLKWRNSLPVVETTDAIMMKAMEIATAHRLSIWDAVVVSASVEAGCQILLSEDMQSGFVWGGLTIINPLASSLHPLLAAILTT